VIDNEVLRASDEYSFAGLSYGTNGYQRVGLHVSGELVGMGGMMSSMLHVPQRRHVMLTEGGILVEHQEMPKSLSRTFRPVYS
jgi:hypothetical protein